jgi:hypothetical protein
MKTFNDNSYKNIKLQIDSDLGCENISGSSSTFTHTANSKESCLNKWHELDNLCQQHNSKMDSEDIDDRVSASVYLDDVVSHLTDSDELCSYFSGRLKS